MGLADDGVTPAPNIHVHAFFAANHQRIEGQLTRQQVIDMFVLDADEITEYDTLAALAPNGSSALATAQKAMFIESIHAVFLLAEERMTGYTTPALVRAKLGI
jgi:hypothetical protein